MWCPAVQVGRTVVCPGDVSRTMLDWALSWSTVGLETELDLVLCAALPVREPLHQLIVVTSNAADGSPFVTALLLPLMVVEVLWSLLL